MASRRVVVRALGGAHARPVAELVRIAQAHPHPVTLDAGNGRAVPLDGVLAVMDLGLQPGTAVTVSTEGDGAEGVLDAVAAVLDPGRPPRPASGGGTSRGR